MRSTENENAKKKKFFKNENKRLQKTRGEIIDIENKLRMYII